MAKNIDKSLTLFILAAVGVIEAFILVFFFLSVWRMRFDTIGQRQQQDAKIFSSIISRQIGNEIENIRGHASSHSFKEAITEANSSYTDRQSDDIEKYMALMDQEWASGSGQLIEKFLNSSLSQELKILLDAETDIVEMFCTDKFGGLVASSDKTSDFYQADEVWWQLAYNNGKGATYFGDVEFDLSSGVISCSIAFPIRIETGEVIGVTKAVVDLKFFLAPLEEYRFGKTGIVALFDQEGNIVFHPKLPMMTKGVFPPEKLAQLTRAEKKYAILRISRSEAKQLVAVSAIESSLFKENGISWSIVVMQGLHEAFDQLYKIFLWSIFLVSIFFLLAWQVMREHLYRIFIIPFHEIKKGVQLFSEGNLEQRIEIKLENEFKELAELLNQMSAHLKSTLVLKDDLIAEVKMRVKAQNELGLKLKEAMNARAVMISMLEDNNYIRVHLEKSLKELKQAQLMIIQSEKLEAIGLIASGVAHEVKNPLGIILQGVNYFEGYLPPGEKNAREILEVIKKNILRADTIIRGLMDFSRVERLNMNPADINVLVENSLELVRPAFRLQEIKIVKELKEGLPWILADKVKIEQAFVNLFSNSIHAMQAGGTLTIRTYLTKLEDLSGNLSKKSDLFGPGEEILIVEIEDTGEGISAENIGKVFEPFFTTKEPGKGTGLGLSVTHSIIEMHRGIINIGSEKGKGTKITICFKKGD